MAKQDFESGEALDFFRGGGETAELMRRFDWRNNPLGEPESWPQSLKTAVRIMMTSRQPIWVGWGAELTYLYNDPYRTIVGGKHPWALARPVLEVWPELHDDILPMLRQAMESGRGTYVEDQLLLMERSGYPEETYYTFSYSPITDDTGRIRGIFCANTDETQRVISERQMTSLQQLAAATTGVRTQEEACEGCMDGLRSNNRDILFAMLYLPAGSGAALSLAAQFNVPAVSPLRQVELEQWLWPQTLAEFVAQASIKLVDDIPEQLAAHLPTGAWHKPPKCLALLSILPNGDPQRAAVLVLGLNPFRVFDPSYRSFLELLGAQVGSVLANVQAYEEERRRAQSLAEIDRAKTAFFSNVSHEFRSPLTLMLGPLQRVQEDDRLPPELALELQVVERNGQRLVKLVNSLLDFSRVEAGRMRATFHPTDLGRFTAHLASHFGSAMELAGLTFDAHCELLPAPVYVDHAMWEKIVFNLLSNALKFTFRGRIELDLRHHGDEVRLCVADSGTGIPEAELGKVFTRFHRVANASARTHEGSGIGLALVKELVLLHGGTIEVESQVGVGTRFTVRLRTGSAHLPADQVSAPPAEELSVVHADSYLQEALRWLPQAAQSVPPSGVQTDQNLPLVLLVEDNADMRLYIGRVLASHYRVEAVADGVAALEFIGRMRPDLVIADVMMPRLDGFGLLKALREDKALAEMLVVLLSARAGEEAEIEGLQAGADEYLVKPFSARELVARVDALFARRAQLREQETHFRAIADSAPAMLWTTDSEGVCTYLSAEWFKCTGGSPEDDLNLGWTRKIHPDDYPKAAETFNSTNKTQEPFRLLYRLRQRTGAYRWMIDSGTPRFADDNRFIGFVGCVFDVHEQIMGEALIKASEEKLRDADRRKDEFLATLAHELRNPLAPIGNALEILKLSASPAQRAAALDVIDRQTQQMVRLVDDLMDVSRITRGKVALRRTALDLGEVLRDAVETTSPMINAQGQTLSLETPLEPLWLEGDLTRLAQVFSNILNNASKYTSEGGSIVIEATADEQFIQVSVTDNGIGIPQEKLDVIFDMFLQLDSSLGRLQGGLGIGLTLVKQLVALHGGTIAAVSDGVGKGSRFTVSLPRLLGHVQATPAVDPARMSASGAARALRILVVDDNENSATTLSELLQLQGYQCSCEFNGAMALKKIRNDRPDVVLLDLGMPGMDGFELCRLIKQTPEFQHIVCISQTGWSEKQHLERSREVGFDDHLVKPVDLHKLAGMLERVGAQEV